MIRGEPQIAAGERHQGRSAFGYSRFVVLNCLSIAQRGRIVCEFLDWELESLRRSWGMYKFEGKPQKLDQALAAICGEWIGNGDPQDLEQAVEFIERFSEAVRRFETELDKQGVPWDDAFRIGSSAHRSCVSWLSELASGRKDFLPLQFRSLLTRQCERQQQYLRQWLIDAA